jgi:hypothetical protein
MTTAYLIIPANMNPTQLAGDDLAASEYPASTAEVCGLPGGAYSTYPVGTPVAATIPANGFPNSAAILAFSVPDGSTYTGPLVRLQLPGNPASAADFGASASVVQGRRWLSKSAIQAWAGGVTLVEIATVYDQSGNNRPLTQATSANRYFLDLTQPFPFARATVASTMTLPWSFSNTAAISFHAVLRNARSRGQGAGAVIETILISTPATSGSRIWVGVDTFSTNNGNLAFRLQGTAVDNKLTFPTNLRLDTETWSTLALQRTAGVESGLMTARVMSGPALSFASQAVVPMALTALNIGASGTNASCVDFAELVLGTTPLANQPRLWLEANQRVAFGWSGGALGSTGPVW